MGSFWWCGRASRWSRGGYVRPDEQRRIRTPLTAVPIHFAGTTSESVFGFDDVSCAFTDDDAGGHGVAGGDAGHDRPVGDTKAFDPIHFQLTVNHRHGVLAHLGGAALVPVGRGGIANEALELSTLEIARHRFAFGEGPKRW